MNILLAEDNDADVFLVHEALRAHAIEYELRVLTNGTEVEQYFELLGKVAAARCPDVFLLDLNLPQTDGHDVLRQFRAHYLCSTVPVIIVTSSDAPKDRELAELLGANAYFRKPSDLEEFMKLGIVIKAVVQEPAA
jgi:chemotaxis family two-component system response regulator Rcp1